MHVIGLILCPIFNLDITLSIAKFGSGADAYLNFEISWAKIDNVVKLGGAIVPILKQVANSNGQLWNGGDGAGWDGIGRAAAPYGLNRSSFETGMGSQSVGDELSLLEDEKTFIENGLQEIGVQNTSVFDNLENLGENGDGDGTPGREWDALVPVVEEFLGQDTGLDGFVDTYGSPSGQWYKEIP
jgi:hypothetical protein